MNKYSEVVEVEGLKFRYNREDEVAEVLTDKEDNVLDRFSMLTEEWIDEENRNRILNEYTDVVLHGKNRE